MKTQIQKLDDNNKVIATYDNLMVAAKSIETRMDPWKVALSIAYAVTHNKRAYKTKWRQIAK